MSASWASVPGESPFAKWSNRPSLMFGYDPGYPTTPPFIVSLGKDRALISVPEVSNIWLQRRKWKNVSIAYGVGRVIYNDVYASEEKRR